MIFWHDIATYLIVGAAAVYCGSQLLLLGKKWSGAAGGCSRGCGSCPSSRAAGITDSAAQQKPLVQISRPGKP